MAEDSSTIASHTARKTLASRVWSFNDWYLHRIPGGAGLMRPRQVINLLAQHWLPWVMCSLIWLQVFLVNMLQKERSMSRYPSTPRGCAAPAFCFQTWLVCCAACRWSFGRPGSDAFSREAVPMSSVS